MKLNPLDLILHLHGGDLARTLVREGETAARAELEKLLHRRVDVTHLDAITAKMQEEGWTWDGPAGRDVPDEGLGRGFLLSRDALYRVIHLFAQHAGRIIDWERDRSDNEVWQAISPLVTEGVTPLGDIVQWTAYTWIALAARDAVAAAKRLAGP